MAPTLLMSQEVYVATKTNVRTPRRALGCASSSPEHQRTSRIGYNILLATELAIDYLRKDRAEVGVAACVWLVVTV